MLKFNPSTNSHGQVADRRSNDLACAQAWCAFGCRGTSRLTAARRLFEHAPVGIALVSIDGGWLQYNERFRQLVGYTREQLARMTFTDLTHPEDAKCEVTLMRRMLGGERGTTASRSASSKRRGSIGRWKWCARLPPGTMARRT
jgi:PAS domain S-box-containing protein